MARSESRAKYGLEQALALAFKIPAIVGLSMARPRRRLTASSPTAPGPRSSMAPYARMDTTTRARPRTLVRIVIAYLRSGVVVAIQAWASRGGSAVTLLDKPKL